MGNYTKLKLLFITEGLCFPLIIAGPSSPSTRSFRLLSVPSLCLPLPSPSLPLPAGTVLLACISNSALLSCFETLPKRLFPFSPFKMDSPETPYKYTFFICSSCLRIYLCLPSSQTPAAPHPLQSGLCGAFLPLKYRILVCSFLFSPRRYVLSALLAADNDLPLLL